MAILATEEGSRSRAASRVQRATRTGDRKMTTREFRDWNQVTGMVRVEVNARSIFVSAHNGMVLPSCS